MRLTRRMIAPAAALTVAAGALAYAQIGSGSSRPAPFIVVDERGDGAELNTGPGVVAVTSMVTLRVTAPFTLLRVAPLRTDPDVEVVAVRALFWGRDDSRTRSGYRRLNASPLVVCGNSPLTGHGPTYPVEGLRLQPGDTTLKLLYYTRSQTPGRRAAFGYRITYRTPDGRTRTVSGENMEIIHTVYRPGEKPTKNVAFHPRCRNDRWTSPYPGYPN